MTRPLLRCLLAAATLWPALAAADDVDPADWALPDPAVAVVFRGANGLADLIDETERRYGRSARVKHAVAALRGWTHDGVAPARRQWGPGLALEHGVGIWIGPDAQVRVVVGASDPDAARATLAKWGAVTGLPITATAEGFTVNARRVPCAARGVFVVCDSAGVAAEPPGRPATYAPSRALEVELGPQGIIMAGVELPVSRARFVVEADGDTVRGRLTGEMIPAAGEALSMLGDPEGESRGLGTIDARSPVVLKLSFDAPRLFEMFGAERPSNDPLGALVAGLRLAWRGDLVLSFAPSIMQPVLALGLNDGRDGRAIIDGLVVALAGEDGIRAIDKGGVLAIEVDGDARPYRLKVRHRVLDGALVFALSDHELDRIGAARVLPPHLPPDFARRGTHGLWASGLSGLFGPRPLDVFEIPEPALAALFDLAWVQLARLDTATWVMRITPETLTAELSWRLL